MADPNNPAGPVMDQASFNQILLQVQLLTNQQGELQARVQNLSQENASLHQQIAASASATPGHTNTGTAFVQQEAKVSKFTGEANTITGEDFLKEIQAVSFLGRELDHENKIALAVRATSGPAREWWVTVSAQASPARPFATFEDFAAALKRQFASVNSKDIAANALRAIKQKPDESVAAYQTRFTRSVQRFKTAGGKISEDTELEKFRFSILRSNRIALDNHIAGKRAEDPAYEIPLEGAVRYLAQLEGNPYPLHNDSHTPMEVNAFQTNPHLGQRRNNQQPHQHLRGNNGSNNSRSSRSSNDYRSSNGSNSFNGFQNSHRSNGSNISGHSNWRSKNQQPVNQHNNRPAGEGHPCWKCNAPNWTPRHQCGIPNAERTQ